jgi:hypothetical protein
LFFLSKLLLWVCGNLVRILFGHPSEVWNVLIATLSSSTTSLRNPALFVSVSLFLKTVADVHGRTFAVWTLLTCTLCVLCALNLSNRALYQATFLSFVYALGYFLIECFIYGTMAPKNVASLFIFAGTCRPERLLSCKRLASVLGFFSNSPSLSLSPNYLVLVFFVSLSLTLSL